MDFSKGPRKEKVGGATTSLGLDERLFRELVLAPRASCRFRQDELVRPVLAGNLRQNPIERNLGVVGMAMLAGFE